MKELQRAVISGSVDYPAAGQVRWEPVQGEGTRSFRAHLAQPNVPLHVTPPDASAAAFMVMGNNPHVFGFAGGQAHATLGERMQAGEDAIKRIGAALNALREKRADEGKCEPSAEDSRPRRRDRTRRGSRGSDRRADAEREERIEHLALRV